MHFPLALINTAHAIFVELERLDVKNTVSIHPYLSPSQARVLTFIINLRLVFFFKKCEDGGTGGD